MSHISDYGFLTRIEANAGKNKTEYIGSKEQLMKPGCPEMIGLNLATEKELQISHLQHHNGVSEKKKKKEAKTNWWKTMFSSKKGNKKQLKTINGDTNSGLRSSRDRKCQSMIERSGAGLLEEGDLPGEDVMSRDDQHDVLKKRLVKISAPGSGAQTREANVQATQSNLMKARVKPNANSLQDLSVINEENDVTTDHQMQSQKAREKSKSTKSLRNALSLKRQKSDESEKHLETQAKSKIKRSKSLLSLRNPFSTRHKTPKSKAVDEQLARDRIVANSSSTEHFLSELKTKLSVAAPENHSFNIYEKYPSKKTEQQKFLVHIHTREEIPVSDGIPQWDTESYRYVGQRPKSCHLPTWNANSTRPKRIHESSFIGKTDVCSTSSELLAFSKTRSMQKSESSDAILSLERELPSATQQRHVLVEDVMSNSTDSQKDKVKNNEESITQRVSEYSATEKKNNGKLNLDLLDSDVSSTHPSTLSEQNPVDFADDISKSDEQQLSSSSTTDKNFGRSFVLTGVSSTSEEPDSIVLKHPYLAESKPLLRMAKCLRHAIKSNMPKRLSHNEEKSFNFPPPPDSWCEMTRDEEEIQNNSSGINCKSMRFSPRHKFQGDTTDISQCSFDRIDTPSPAKCPKRSYSESDLSSFFVAPMKLDNRYLGKDESIRSPGVRNSRTQLLLNRMHHRIERLKKLTDTKNARKPLPLKAISPISSHSSAKAPSSGSCNHPKQPHGQRNTRNAMHLLQHENRGGTSLQHFKKLINQHLERGKLGRPTARAAVCLTKRPSTVHHQATNSDPLYDYIWPECEEKVEADQNTEVVHFAATKLNNTTNPRNSLPIASQFNSCNYVESHQPTKLTFSSTNARPISSAQVIVNGRKDFNHSSCVEQSLIKSLPWTNDVELQPDFFMASTPVKVKTVTKSTAHIDDEEEFNLEQSGFDLSNQENSDELLSNSSCSFKKFLTLPQAPLLFKKYNQQDQIRSTMLQEMKKISNKYSVHDAPSCTNRTKAAGQNFFEQEQTPCLEEGFEKALRLRTTSGHQDHDATSGGDSSASDFDGADVIQTANEGYKKETNLYFTSDASLKSSGGWQDQSLTEYDDLENFLEWDCEETDL